MLARSSSSACGLLQCCDLVLHNSVRAVSSKYPKPKARHYKRRLFEGAVAPVLPRTVQQCVPPLQHYIRAVEKSRAYEDYELALADLVKRWLQRNEFRVLAVCQFTAVPSRTLHLSKNQLRMKGVEFRNYSNKTMKKVFEGTPLSSLVPVLEGNNAILVGKTEESLVTISQECRKLNYIFPLVYAMDSRIVSVTEVEYLASLPSVANLYAETTQILDRQIHAIPQSLDAIPHQLVNTLSHLSVRESPKEEQK